MLRYLCYWGYVYPHCYLRRFVCSILLRYWVEKFILIYFIEVMFASIVIFIFSHISENIMFQESILENLYNIRLLILLKNRKILKCTFDINFIKKLIFILYYIWKISFTIDIAFHIMRTLKIQLENIHIFSLFLWRES